MTAESDERERLYHARRQWRESRGEPKLAIEVHGPRRDYDYSLFCVDHNVEAEECAALWTAELIDHLAADEEAEFHIKVRLFTDDDECCICNPLREP